MKTAAVRYRCPTCGWSYAAAWAHPVCANPSKETTVLIRSATIVDAPTRPPAPLYEYRDPSGSTWQMSEEDAARNPLLVKLSDVAIVVPAPRPRLMAEVAPSAEDARQVADGSAL